MYKGQKIVSEKKRKERTKILDPIDTELTSYDKTYILFAISIIGRKLQNKKKREEKIRNGRAFVCKCAVDSTAESSNNRF